MGRGLVVAPMLRLAPNNHSQLNPTLLTPPPAPPLTPLLSHHHRLLPSPPPPTCAGPEAFCCSSLKRIARSRAPARHLPGPPARLPHSFRAESLATAGPPASRAILMCAHMSPLAHTSHLAAGTALEGPPPWVVNLPASALSPWQTRRASTSADWRLHTPHRSCWSLPHQPLPARAPTRLCGAASLSAGHILRAPAGARPIAPLDRVRPCGPPRHLPAPFSLFASAILPGLPHPFTPSLHHQHPHHKP